LKVTSEIKNKLDAAARLGGRSQSQEAEARIERTFHDEADIIAPESRLIARRLLGHYNLGGSRLVVQLLLSLPDAHSFEDPNGDEIARRRKEMADLLLGYLDPDPERDAAFFLWLTEQGKIVGERHRAHHAARAAQ
jgi:hypothetical protein